MTTYKTTDLCDAYGARLQVAEPLFRDYGGVTDFWGEIVTLKVADDNTLVRKKLEGDGRGKVLVVDGGGSTRCALLGDQLALLATKNDWAGVIVNGCIRDSRDIANMAIGVKARATTPRRSDKNNTGGADVVVQFANVVFTPGHYLYADRDGIVVVAERLPAPT
jgi:regulator of ribonuclease activity A